jgi:hypothetical protein
MSLRTTLWGHVSSVAGRTLHKHGSCQGSQRLMENVWLKCSHHDYQCTDCSHWYAVFCSASSSMYWCPDRSELQNLIVKTVHPESVMPSVQGMFVYGLMLSWRINNSLNIVVGQTQQTQAFRLLGISVHWLEFTVVSIENIS